MSFDKLSRCDKDNHFDECMDLTHMSIRQYQVPDFDAIKVSTNTIIAITNLIIDTSLFFEYLPVNKYFVDRKKRGRKKFEPKVFHNDNVEIGSIVSLQRKHHDKLDVRGVLLKEHKNKDKTSFLNSITVIMLVELNKLVNIKVSQNGKFQITGCRTEKHYIDTIQFLYAKMEQTQAQIGEQICYTRDGKNPTCIFNIVMRNYKFKVGFPLHRQNLDAYINENTDYSSSFEVCFNPSVIIKIEARTLMTDPMTQIELDKNSSAIIKTQITYAEYLAKLDPKEQDKKLKKKRYHTFLCFSSGQCILSSQGSHMPDIYKTFLNLIYENRNKFEEIIHQTKLLT